MTDNSGVFLRSASITKQTFFPLKFCSHPQPEKLVIAKNTSIPENVNTRQKSTICTPYFHHSFTFMCPNYEKPRKIAISMHYAHLIREINRSSERIVSAIERDLPIATSGHEQNSILRKMRNKLRYYKQTAQVLHVFFLVAMTIDPEKGVRNHARGTAEAI